MRNKKLMIRLSEEEYLEVKAKADNKGLSMAAYTRMVIMNEPTPEQLKVIEELIKEET